MKVAILTERMLLGFGVDLVVHEQATRLEKMGHEVTVFTARADTSTKREYVLHVLSELVPGFHDYTDEAAIRSFLSREDINSYDIWLLHTPPFYAWIRHLEKPVVFVEYGCPPGHFFNQDIAYHLWRMVSTHFSYNYGCLRPSDAVVSISQDIHDSLPSNVKSYSSILYLGSDHYPKARAGEALRFRHAHGVQDEDCLILWVGRMQFTHDEQPYKGFADFLKLVPTIKQISPHVKVACLGKIDHSEMHYFDDLGIILLPNFPSDQMGVAYAASDVLLNLSRWEGFNLALTESQFQGTPVVAYDLGPHPEVTQNGETALLVKDRDDIAPALRQLVEDNALRQEMGSNAVRFASRFSWDENTRQLNALLEDCRRHFLATPPPARLQLQPHPSPSTVAVAIDTVTESCAGCITEEELTSLLAQEESVFVEKAYWVLLGRHPDLAGRTYYLSGLSHGKSRLSVLRDIARSEECRRRNIELPPRLVIPFKAWGLRDLVESWTNRLSYTSVKRLNSVLALEDEAFLHAAYKLILKRPADESGIRHFASRLRQTGDKLAILANLHGSREARALRPPNLMLPWILRYRRLQHALGKPGSPPILKLDDTAFVHEAYDLVLGRQADQEGLRHHVSRLRATGDKRQILLDLCFSPEGRMRMEEHKALRNVLRRFKGRKRGLAAALRLNLVPLYQQSDRVDALERRLHDIDMTMRNLSGGVQLLLQHAETSCTSPPSRPSSPAAYRSELSSNYACLHAPGVQIDEEAYARMTHIAEITGADLIFGDEWIVQDNEGRVPFLRSAFSHYSFLEWPDLGGAIAIRRTVIANAGLNEAITLSGEALLLLMEHVHSIVHQPGLLCQRRASDLRANLPSAAAITDYVAKLPGSVRVAHVDEDAINVRWVPVGPSRALILIACDDDDAMKANGDSLAAHCAPTEGTSIIHRVPRSEGPAAINTAVRNAPDDCDIIVFVGEFTPVTPNWLDRLIEMASRPNVGMVGGLVLTTDNRIVDAGWHIGPRGMVRPRARFRPYSQEASRIDAFIDPATRLQEVSAIDLGCAAMRRSVFVDIGGLDESLSESQAGIDLSIRVRSLELSILFDGHVVVKGKKPLMPHTIGNETDSRNFLQKHQDNLKHIDQHSTFYYDGVTIDTDIQNDIINFNPTSHRKTFVAPMTMRA